MQTVNFKFDVHFYAGNYDGASIYYEALIPSLQRFTANISDPMRKGKWTMVSKMLSKLDLTNSQIFSLINQVQQQINKEYQQMKAIQKELTEMTMDLHNAPFRRPTKATESEYKDPAAWFRPDPDIWAPPVHHDPDVFAPPIDRFVAIQIIVPCLRVIVIYIFYI